MLSSVLSSERAVQVNILIMRAFVRLREVLATHKELARQLEELEKTVSRHDKKITAVFEAIKEPSGARRSTQAPADRLSAEGREVGKRFRGRKDLIATIA